MINAIMICMKQYSDTSPLPGITGWRRIATVILIAMIQIAAFSLTPVLAEDLSPQTVLVDWGGRRLFVAELTGRQVVAVDLVSWQVMARVKVPDQPAALALSLDGRKLYVAGAAPEGHIYAVDVERFRVVATYDVGHTPSALAVGGDGSVLYVCNRFNNDVSVVDLKDGKDVVRIPVSREPVAAAVTPDGKQLVVANLLPAMPADGDYVAAVVTLIDTATRCVSTNITLPNGSTSLRGVCVSPDGRQAYVTHTLARYQLPTTQLDRGWMNTSAISIIDMATRTLFATFLLDDVDLGAANPWGVVCSPDGRMLCVAHAGSHEISIIDRVALNEKLGRLATGQKVSEVSAALSDVPNDLSFLVDIRRRVGLGGNGPRGIAFAGNSIVAAEYFTDSLGVVAVATGAPPVGREIALGKPRKQTPERMGEMYFNDARFCFQHWQSCATCHPDGRVDGLNWDLLNDGIGNPKNVKNMLLAFKTPPSMSFGIREDAAEAVRAGIKYIQFAVRPEEDAAAIDSYLKAMKPVPSPRLVKGSLSKAARRGAKGFTKAGCAACHRPPLFTNLEQYDVGTATGLDKGKPIDTPSLVEAWRTAPYLHTGGAMTVKDAFLRCSVGKECGGGASKLSPEEMSDLSEYILSQ